MKAIFGVCVKCRHYWFIRVKIPKWCPSCHTPVVYDVRFFGVDESNAIEQPDGAFLIKPDKIDCKPGDLVVNLISVANSVGGCDVT
jgi:hypothetical protein